MITSFSLHVSPTVSPTPAADTLVQIVETIFLPMRLDDLEATKASRCLENLFTCLLNTRKSTSVKRLLKHFVHFSIEFCVFFLLICGSSLHKVTISYVYGKYLLPLVFLLSLCLSILKKPFNLKVVVSFKHFFGFGIFVSCLKKKSPNSLMEKHCLTVYILF